MTYSNASRHHRPDCVFTVSARSKPPEVPVFRFLRRHFGYIPLGSIGSMFGFVERSTLYGGRKFHGRELSERDVAQLNNAGIGIRIPLSNHFATQGEYEQCMPLLEKYHHEPNSVIVTNDDLAQWIRADFPHYRIDASVIKNINNLKKLRKALEIYDEVVLPMTSNEDLPFLESIEDKHRITLFANAGCAFTCPSKTCYVSVSKSNKGDREQPFVCSQSTKEREQLGMIDFELQPLVNMGFRSFKMLRPAPGMMTGF
jgi:collagenase-like PrtC family protease